MMETLDKTYEIVLIDGKEVLREEASLKPHDRIRAHEWNEHLKTLKSYPISGHIAEVGTKGLIEKKDFYLVNYKTGGRVVKSNEGIPIGYEEYSQTTAIPFFEAQKEVPVPHSETGGIRTKEEILVEKIGGTWGYVENWLHKGHLPQVLEAMESYAQQFKESETSEGKEGELDWAMIEADFYSSVTFWFNKEDGHDKLWEWIEKTFKK